MTNVLSRVVCRPVLRGLLIAGLAALFACSAGAQCTQWDVSGKWSESQSDGYKVYLDLQQSNGILSGNAKYGYVVNHGKILGVIQQGGDPVTVTGTVSGKIVGNEYYAEITWKGRGKGIYHGKVSSNLGILSGNVHDFYDPKASATWSSDRGMNCIAAPPPPPPQQSRSAAIAASTPKPIHLTGGGRVIPHIPGIIASPVVSDSTTLRWDGGADHPYAEVWVKIGSADETKILEKGKGSMPYKIEHGKRYLFILTDAGVRLATVQVVGP